MASVFVTDPGVHWAHGTVATGENHPGGHAVHVVAPAFGPVSVAAPGAQASQLHLETFGVRTL